ncbi:hypothetical protein K1719_010020 [Acacia pycnantha]|nr:hypothetical protein K1719_010020 [Acacia pycnantha]
MSFAPVIASCCWLYTMARKLVFSSQMRSSALRSALGELAWSRLICWNSPKYTMYKHLFQVSCLLEELDNDIDVAACLITEYNVYPLLIDCLVNGNGCNKEISLFSQGHGNHLSICQGRCYRPQDFSFAVFITGMTADLS